MLGTKRTFGVILSELAADWDNLFVLAADVKTYSGLDRFAKGNPDKFLSCGIAEQNMVCIASGLASEGKIVFAASFAPFMTGRCYDQIRIHLGMMRHNVKLVGLGSGVSLGNQGNTHFGLDDSALMCLIPNMTVISPADCAEVAKAVEAAYFFKGPVYLRLGNEANMVVINKENYDFKIGKAIKLREGGDITIFTSGSMVYQSLKAAEFLHAEKLDTAVVNMHTIKPIDKAAVDESLESGLIVVVDESLINGGLTAMILQYLSTKQFHPPVLTLGVNDVFPVTGNYEYMLEQIGLTAKKISNKIKNRIKSNSRWRVIG